jgi:hypothetical protein
VIAKVCTLGTDLTRRPFKIWGSRRQRWGSVASGPKSSHPFSRTSSLVVAELLPLSGFINALDLPSVRVGGQLGMTRGLTLFAFLTLGPFPSVFSLSVVCTHRETIQASHISSRSPRDHVNVYRPRSRNYEALSHVSLSGVYQCSGSAIRGRLGMTRSCSHPLR